MSSIYTDRPDAVLDAIRTNRFSICIGGFNLAIKAEDTPFLDELRARYRWFASVGPADYEVAIQLAGLKELAVDNRGQPRGPTISTIYPENIYIIRRTDNPFIAIFDTRTGNISLKMWSSQYCFDSFLRVLFTLLLADQGGLLLHASAIGTEGRGSIFFGSSGSGKTTVTRLSSGRTILTDELALIKPCNGGYRVYGTPFWGEFTPGNSNESADLKGLYLLKKAKSNYLVPLGRAQAIAEIYQCVLFFSNEKHLLGRVLDTCSNLAASVPVQALHFLPDPSFWQILDTQNQRGG